MRFVSLNKDSHVLEIPQARSTSFILLRMPQCSSARCYDSQIRCLQGLAKRVPDDFELVAQRKGFNRYMTPRLRELVDQHNAVLKEREAVINVSFMARPCYTAYSANVVRTDVSRTPPRRIYRTSSRPSRTPGGGRWRPWPTSTCLSASPAPLTMRPRTARSAAQCSSPLPRLTLPRSAAMPGSDSWHVRKKPSAVARCCGPQS